MRDDFPWPPPFALRISKRAKHARLRVLPDSGLELVLPRAMPRKAALEILEGHKEWVRKALKRVFPVRAAAPENTPPETIILHGGETLLRAVYGQRACFLSGKELFLRSGGEKPEAAVNELQRWLRRYAAETLGREAASLAERFGLPYASLRFRRQRSRWGSCSARGNLSLNICLVFLPPRLARHVILHELAHTRHCNHGREFRETLRALEPDTPVLDAALREAWRHVPAWIWQ
jgi:predicted metal-dependent hydrolase